MGDWRLEHEDIKSRAGAMHNNDEFENGKIDVGCNTLF